MLDVLPACACTVGPHSRQGTAPSPLLAYGPYSSVLRSMRVSMWSSVMSSASPKLLAEVTNCTQHKPHSPAVAKHVRVLPRTRHHKRAACNAPPKCRAWRCSCSQQRLNNQTNSVAIGSACSWRTA